MRKEIPVLVKNKKWIIRTELGEIDFSIPVIKNLLNLQSEDNFKIIHEREDKK